MVTDKKSKEDSGSGIHWTFLTNHAHVLLCLARDPDIRLRDVAQRVNITERAVQKIVADLEKASVLTRTREGRRNHYSVKRSIPLRHPLEAHCDVGQLIDMVEEHIAPAHGPGEAHFADGRRYGNGNGNGHGARQGAHETV